MKAIEIDFKKETMNNVERAGMLNVKKNGSLTRPAAAVCSIIELINNSNNINTVNTVNAVDIDEYCFTRTGFTLSGNKSRGTSKNSGGQGKLYSRLNDYLNRDKSLFSYNRYRDEITFTEKGKALLLSQKRENVKLQKKIPVGKNLKLVPVKFKGRKALLTQADKKKVSKQLTNHLK